MANRIITINRMYGSNGRLIGKALAERLDIPFYDKELITLASQENDIPLEELKKVDEKKANQWHLPIKDAMQMEPQYHFQPMNDVLFESQSKIIHDLAEKETVSSRDAVRTRSWRADAKAFSFSPPLSAG